MKNKIVVLGLSGSLRRKSYNKSLLHATKYLMPEEAKLEIFDITEIPLFNQDLELQMPKKVQCLKSKIESVDAILIVSPEYNSSIPGVLKNVLDWASRPSGKNSFYGKPVAIMGASNGRLGTVRAQFHIRQVCVSLNMHPINDPQVYVTYVDEKIDEDGNLIDDETRYYVKKLLLNLVNWVKQLRNFNC
jgi:chromate reductase